MLTSKRALNRPSERGNNQLVHRQLIAYEGLTILRNGGSAAARDRAESSVKIHSCANKANWRGEQGIGTNLYR